MNTDWLYSFVAVAETGSFTEAAYAMYQSQSVISKHIQKLEQELQVQLFHRDHRQAVLTASGTAILPEARRILRQLERLKEAAHPDLSSSGCRQLFLHRDAVRFLRSS